MLCRMAFVETFWLPQWGPLPRNLCGWSAKRRAVRLDVLAEVSETHAIGWGV